MNNYPGIFAAPDCKKFAQKICQRLKAPLGKIKFELFSDGERWCKYEENIRGRHVFLISSSTNPLETWFDLWIMIDAARRASADEITAVVPYYRFSRQERKDESRVPITASMVADITEFLKADRILTMDLHADATQGSTLIPFDHLYGSDTLIKAAFKQEPTLAQKKSKITAIAGDPGALKFVRPIAERHDWNFAFVDKKRAGHEKLAKEEILPIFSDVPIKDSTCLILDDIASTFGSLEKVSYSLARAEAKKIFALVTHPVFAGPALDRLTASKIEKIWVGDTIPLSAEIISHPKIKVVSMAPIFAKAIKKIFLKESVTSLFPDKK